MQITSESIKAGHPIVVADAIAANIIAAILDEENGQWSGFGEESCQQALVGGVEMLNKDESDARLRSK